MLSVIAERDRLSGGTADMTVIRHGKPVRLTVPPLPDKALGARLQGRAVPIATFGTWKNIGAEKKPASVTPGKH